AQRAHRQLALRRCMMAEPLGQDDSHVDPWLASDRTIAAHPDSPAGGGGTGGFGGTNLPGSDVNPNPPLPHPQAPPGQTLAFDYARNEAEQLDDAPTQPAPVVSKDETKKAGGIDVTIKADQTGVQGVSGAGTTMAVDPGEVPEIEFDEQTKK